MKSSTSGLPRGNEKQAKTLRTVLWVLLAIAAVVFIVTGLTEGYAFGSLGPVLVVGALFAFVFIHGTNRYGIKTMAIFFIITFVISWSYETLSIFTGFPFGHYHYSDELGVKLGVVPLLIMPTYFSASYLCWTIAQVLLDQRNSKLNGASVFTIPFFAAFLMVIWDLCFDPYSSTIRKIWIWEEGGGYFGVPIENFLGWFLCTYTVFQIFALYLRFGYYKKSDDKTEQTRTLYLMPCLMYGALAMQHVLFIFSGGNSPITTLDNRVWIDGDIKEALTTVCLFTMVFISALSCTKLLSKKDEISVNQRNR